jgi:hypothetical protein
MVAMSINATTKSSEQNIVPTMKFGSEYDRYRPANRVAVRSSMMKYLAGICRPQQRAFPRRHSHDTSGMFSQNGMAAPHSHLERGKIIDFPSGILHTHTPRKLPTQAPIVKIKAKSISLG